MNNSLVGIFALLISPVIAILAFCLLARILFFRVNVVGLSMYPALNDGDQVLALRYWPTRWLRKGQIVVLQFELTEWFSLMNFKLPDNTLCIKRLLGLPGDDMTIPSQEILQPPCRSYHQMLDDQGQRTWHIPLGHCFVKGDSPGFDSTIVGPIPFHTIQGVVLTILTKKITSGLHQPVSINQPPEAELPE
jgi:signal peptidase I